MPGHKGPGKLKVRCNETCSSGRNHTTYSGDIKKDYYNPGLHGEEEFLPVFVRFDVEAPIGAPKIGASVPVLGEAFAHDSFAKSTKFTLPSVLTHDKSPLVRTTDNVSYETGKRRPPPKDSF
jgi:hypothetical protein